MEKDNKITVNTGDHSLADSPKPLTCSEQNHLKQVKKRRAIRQSAPVLTTLCLLTMVAWLLPLRPTVSDAEKRELEKFPDFSMESLMDGSYFRQIDAWFTDTFTFREFWVSRTMNFKSLYGIRTVALYGDIGISDDVPVIPTPVPALENTSAPVTPSALAANTPAPTPTPEPSPTVEPTPTPWGGDAAELDEYVGTGAVLQIGDSAYKITGFSQYYADRYIEVMNKVADRLEGKANLYCMVVPENTSFMLRASDRQKYGCALEEDMLAYIYSCMNEGVNTVNIFDTLVAHNNEYVAFRTDHHWTALGAYYAYKEWCKAAGVDPVPLTEYEEIQWPGFLGTYYYRANKIDLMAKNPDTVYAYAPPGDVHMYLNLAHEDDLGIEHDILIDRTHASSGGMYLTFLGSDSAKVTFVNNDIQDGSACLIVKTSVGNPYAYYMTQHYQYVYVVDIRHYFTRSLVDFVEHFEIDDVLFVHGTGLSQTDRGTGLIDWFAR